MISPRFPLIFRHLTAIFSFGSVALASPVISEFGASNGALLEDEDGDASDWIEIHNSGDVDFDLSGCFLSDDDSLERRWVFPDLTTLPAGERIIVFASGKDRSDGDEFHTNFALSASGGYLALVDSANTVLYQYVDYPEQRIDISYGIGNNSDLGFFSRPTPGTANGLPVGGLADNPEFSVKRGFYDAPIQLVITPTGAGNLIRYTTDGTNPTSRIGTPYRGPITIDSTTVVRAVVYGSRLIPSPVETQSYLFPGDIVDQVEMDPAITDSPEYRDEMNQALTSLPVVSLSFRNNDLFGFGGIYRSPQLRGRESERDIYFEYFNPTDPGDSVGSPGGIRIHGGNARDHPKKPLRIYFRKEYGNSRLEHDIYPDSEVKSFKRLLLRGGGHDSWLFRGDWDEATFIRNMFHHKNQLAMGQNSPDGRSVNLFLNGQYWGLYEFQEFPHEHYNADHHGGDPEDWDVIKHGREVEAGNRQAWDAMSNIARNGINSPEDYEALQEYIDPVNLADSMIQRIWASDEDWLSPYFLGNTEIDSFSDDKNWYAARKSRNGTSKYYFYNWDSEMSMGIPFSANRTFSLDFSRVSNSGSPGRVYNALRQYEEFQVLFGDRLQKHCFNGGALTTESLQERWDTLADLVRSPVVAESARWGKDVWSGSNRVNPFTRNVQWNAAENYVRNTFIPNRTNAILTHFRNVGLFPEEPAPVATPRSTLSPTPFDVTLTTDSLGSVIYYTIDGTDPRVPGGLSSETLISEDSQVRAIIPTAQMDAEIGEAWKDIDPPSNLSSWTLGPNGVGFEITSGYQDFIGTNLPDMHAVNSSAYLRYEFNIADEDALNAIQSLILKMRYDDGFGAYLNGTLVASDNFSSAVWNSRATTSRPDAEAIVFRDFNITIHRSSLQVGTNVLAIHGQNASLRNSDFLIEAVLESTSFSPGTAKGVRVYDGPISIDGSFTITARSFNLNDGWSPLIEEYYSAASPASADNLTASEVHYHPAEPILPEETAVSTNRDDYEFLELFNRSEQTVDLNGCTFDRGLSFTFPQGCSIPARSRRIIVSDRSAFLARYGAELDSLILGEFADGSNLSNGGETLSLRDPEGALIFAFQYDDQAPWPTTPDGEGPSLVLRDADTSGPDLNFPTGWTASQVIHGSPGSIENPTFNEWLVNRYGSDSGPGTGPDEVAPGESESNLILYATGNDLTSFPGLFAPGEGSYAYSVRSSLEGVSLIAEFSSNLIDWEAAEVVSSTDSPNGTSRVTVTPPASVEQGVPVFFRLKATLQP